MPQLISTSSSEVLSVWQLWKTSGSKQSLFCVRLDLVPTRWYLFRQEEEMVSCWAAHVLYKRVFFSFAPLFCYIVKVHLCTGQFVCSLRYSWHYCSIKHGVTASSRHTLVHILIWDSLFFSFTSFGFGIDLLSSALYGLSSFHRPHTHLHKRVCEKTLSRN